MLLPLPYDDSRRLTGTNLYFAGPGAVIETLPDPRIDKPLLALWKERVEFAVAILDWPPSFTVARRQSGGTAFAISAPADQLFVATEVNEWAFLHAYYGGEAGAVAGLFHAPAFPPIWDDDLALHTLRLAAAAERHLDLVLLIQQAHQRHLPVMIDDEDLSIGQGGGAKTWPIRQLPAIETLDWRALHAIPVALVAGSNGKTTTTRLVAAMCEAHGWRTAYSCSDGVFVAGHIVAAGDYSGPAGARAALRHPEAQAAVLETARGGILRRGLATERVQAAIVTNISADHFGEYGIRSVDELADTKLVVARAVEAGGLFALNADDALLSARDPTTAARIAWFALDADNARLCAHRATGGATCGVRAGELILHINAVGHRLGVVDNMPLTMHGNALYNVANIAGASLVASSMGVAPATIAAVLARFGAERKDNPGRLMRWSFDTTAVIVDYAHNPDGLHGLLTVARATLANGRLALMLGQAGNRENADIERLAKTAAAFSPAFIVVKDIAVHMRDRSAGEVPAILRDELLRQGIAAPAIAARTNEVEAAKAILAWARSGDVLVLPVHERKARADITALLDRLEALRWRPGDALPG
ncbi:MAG: Mur ligase family protein [Rudaea sp.]